MLPEINIFWQVLRILDLSLMSLILFLNIYCLRDFCAFQKKLQECLVYMTPVSWQQ